MKYGATIIFKDNRFFAWDSKLIKIFGMKLFKAYMMPMNYIFTDETILRFRTLQNGVETEMKVSTREKEILDAKVLKTDFGDSSIIIMNIYKTPVHLDAGRYGMETSLCGNAVDRYMKDIFCDLAKIENSRNKALINDIREKSFNFAGCIFGMINYAFKNEVKNTDLNHIYSDVREFIFEIKDELLKFGNIEFISEGNYPFYTFIKKDALKELIFSLVQYFSEREQRVYIHYRGEISGASLTISNYRYTPAEESVTGTFSDDELQKIVNFISMAVNAGTELKRNIYPKQKGQGFTLIFNASKYVKMCEDI